MKNADVAHINPPLRSLAVPTRTLKQDPKNARRHPERNLAAIEASLRRFGQRTPIVYASPKDRTILKGNGTFEVATQRLGWKYVAAIPSGLEDEATRRAYAVADNRTGELAEWNFAALDAELASLTRAGWDVATDLAFAPKDLDALRRLTPPEETAVVEDAVPPLPKKVATREGDVWTFPTGHRLMCGDSTREADVALLMNGKKARAAFTDPPWNINYGHADNPKWKRREILNDNLNADFPHFLESITNALIANVQGDAYVVMGCKEWPTIDAAMRATGYHWSGTIIWNKDVLTIGRNNYQNKYEPIWYGWPEKSKSTWNGARDESNVWDIPRPKDSPDHPTTKPVALVAKALHNSTRERDLVLDLFLGSGTTLIAAEQANRVCNAMELAPAYVDVALERYYALTGKPPIRDGDKAKWTDVRIPNGEPPA